MRGIVSSVDKAGAHPIAHGPRSRVAFDQVTVDGRAYPIHATVTQATRERRRSRAKPGRSATGAGVGAIIGGILGGARAPSRGILIGGGGTIAATEGDRTWSCRPGPRCACGSTAGDLRRSHAGGRVQRPTVRAPVDADARRSSACPAMRRPTSRRVAMRRSSTCIRAAGATRVRSRLMRHRAGSARRTRIRRYPPRPASPSRRGGCRVDVLRRVRGRQEPRLELRRRRVDAARQHAAEERARTDRCSRSWPTRSRAPGDR